MCTDGDPTRAGGPVPALLALAFPPILWQTATALAFGCSLALASLLLIFRRRLGRLSSTRREQDRFASLFSDTADPMLMLDPDGRAALANPAFWRLHPELERDAPALIGRPIVGLFAGGSRAAVMACMKSALKGVERAAEAVWIPGDTPQAVEISAIPCVVEGRIAGVWMRVRDITQRKQVEEELHGRALHDYLTGLPNRALFQDRLEHALHRVQREGGHVALLYIDLDRFKPVNDHLGHEIGDRVLKQVAVRLQSLIRAGDTVSRVGGDEFAILLESSGDDEQAMSAAKRVVTMLREPVLVDEEEVFIGSSVGIAISDAKIDSPAELVRRADIAMYEAKKRGGFQAYPYHQDLEDDRDQFGDRIEVELRRAMKSDHLLLEYQPIVDVSAERLMGVEALVRWDHPEFGRIYPKHFIPAAEQSSLVAELDRWVLERACREVRELVGRFENRRLLLSVNLSARHFDEEDLVPAVSDIILRTGIDPETLQLEITETAAGGDAEKVRRLKALGLRLAIDDFGSGYSSLGYLRDLAVDVLKVDRSFVLALGADPSSVAIVRTIITLAEILDLEVIIEGIEDPVQLGHLEGLGGRYVQGYLWGRPVSIDSLYELMRDGVRRSDSTHSRDDAAPAGEASGDRRPYVAPVGGRPTDGPPDLGRIRI